LRCNSTEQIAFKKVLACYACRDAESAAFFIRKDPFYPMSIPSCLQLRQFPPALRSLRSFTHTTLVSLAMVLAIGGCSQLEHEERALTFRVAEGTASWYSGLPEGVVESDIAVASNGKPERVHAWWWPGEKRDAPAVLYLHGSRWNLTGQVYRIEELHELGFSVLAIDYRGFGKSSGDLPSEKTVYEDAHAAWGRLAQLQPDAGKRFIYGHSLGGAVAIDLAASLQNPPAAARHGLASLTAPFTRRGRQAAAAVPSANSTSAPTLAAAAATKPGSAITGIAASASTPPAWATTPAKGLIVESSFTTLADVAKSLTYPWLPVQLLLSQKFDSLDKIAHVSVPVLIVHGTEDRYIPSRFSQKLFDAVAGKKRLLLVPGGTHNNSLQLGEVAYRKAFKDLFGIDLQPA
jgi:alpha-beta hydrolase superfamily lysophospholipase